MTATRRHVWDRWDAAFKGVSAYAIHDKQTGEPIAKVGVTFARSGLTTTVYLHVLSFEPAIAKAGGGGYDKQGAAMHEAARKVDVSHLEEGNRHRTLVEALRREHRSEWETALRDAGFSLLQVL